MSTKRTLFALCKSMTRGLDQPLITNSGGEGGIRTPGTFARSTVFETAPFNHSGTSPQKFSDRGHETEHSISGVVE